MATKNIVPRADGEGSLGTSAKKWGAIYADSIVLDDEETLAQKISAQNTRITTAEGNVTTLSGTVETLSGDVTTLYGDIEELSDGKLSLSGGTLTGAYLQRDSDESHISIFGGTAWNKGSRLILRGKDNTSGQFDLIAHNGTNEGALIGKADGTLTWGGKVVVTLNRFTCEKILNTTTVTTTATNFTFSNSVYNYDAIAIEYKVGNYKTVEVVPNGLYGNTHVLNLRHSSPYYSSLQYTPASETTYNFSVCDNSCTNWASTAKTVTVYGLFKKV